MDANVFYPPTTVQIAQGIYNDFFGKSSDAVLKINTIDQGDIIMFMCAIYTALQNRRDVPPEMLAKQMYHEKACEELLAKNIAQVMVSVEDIGSGHFDPEPGIQAANTIAKDIAKAMEKHIQTLPSHQSRRTP